MNYSYDYNPNTVTVKKKKGFPGWAVALIVIGVLSAAAWAVVAALLNSPLASVGRALNASLKAAERSEISEIVNAAADSGSVEIYVDGRGLTSDLLGIEIGAGGRVKFYFDMKDNQKAAVEAALLLNGSEAVDLSAYTDGTYAAAKSEAVFGTKSYGFRFDDVRKKYDDSVWGPDGEYSLETSLNLNYTGDELGDIFESIASSGKSKDETEKLIKSLVTDLLKPLNKYADISKDSGEAGFSSGDTVKTQDVTVTLGGEKLYEFLKDALRILRDNKELNRFLEKHADLLENVLHSSYEDYRDEMNEALESLEDDRDSIEECAFTVTFSISKKNKQLVGVAFRAEEDGETAIEAKAVCGPDWKKPKTVKFVMDMGYSTIDAVCNTEYDDRDGFRSDMQVTADGRTVASGTVDLDGSSGDFTAALTADDETASLKGEYHRAKKDVAVISLDSFTVEGQTYNLSGTSVTVTENDKMPVVNDYQDVLSMSESDVERMAEDIEEFSETFMEKLADSLGALAYFLF